MIYDPTFMGVDNIGSSQIINELENNYKSFLDWGFLNIGAFVNVTRPTRNISNFDLHKLKPTQDKNRKPNTVWQAPRKDWVYETGIDYEGTSPIQISGVYINGTLYPAPTGNSSIGYHINYPEGQIIFNNPIPQNSNVEIEYSYRNIQVYKIDEFPYWREIQHKSLENKLGFSLSNKGDFSIGAEHRVQLPAVIIETIARSNSRPYRLGDKSLIIEQDLLFHILSDNKTDKNNITDILRLQEDRVIWLYNTDTIIKSGVYPLNYNGSKNPLGLNYINIVNNNNYRWIKSQLTDVNISDIFFDNIRMYGSIVRITNEIIYTDFGGAIIDDGSGSGSSGSGSSGSGSSGSSGSGSSGSSGSGSSGSSGLVESNIISLNLLTCSIESNLLSLNLSTCSIESNILLLNLSNCV